MISSQFTVFSFVNNLSSFFVFVSRIILTCFLKFVNVKWNFSIFEEFHLIH